MSKKKRPLMQVVSGEQFFQLLYNDQIFCAQLGRTMLAASRIESELKLYFDAKSITLPDKYLTFGQQIGLLREHNLLLKMQPVLDSLKTQRNYLVHNLHALLVGLIEESLLPRKDLIDLDVHTYTDSVRKSEESLNGLANIISKERKLLVEGNGSD